MAVSSPAPGLVADLHARARWDLWQPGLGIVDFTNPAAREWYAAKLDALIDLGVDTFKVCKCTLSVRGFLIKVWLQTDFGERIPHTGVQFFDGSDPMRMHNTYSVLYNQLVFDVLERRFGRGEAVVFARSSTVGGQRLPVVSKTQPLTSAHI